MSTIKIAVLSFPGNNCEVESMRAIREAGMDPLFFRWNDDREKLRGVEGYFVPGGFSYEDRGRSGMVAAQDPLMDFLHSEAAAGKVIIGNCNGAQILVESGLIPLDSGLRMSLARNMLDQDGACSAPGFLSEWVWITPACTKDRCAVSDWERPMHLPIAHGEGRFVTRDPELITELRQNDQIAFCYCNAQGEISADTPVTPNGSTQAIAGICNPAGNVIALMPHPERTPNGLPYFASMKRWIEGKKRYQQSEVTHNEMPASIDLKKKSPSGVEIFIDTIIVNNEERTIEQAVRKHLPKLSLKQWKYFCSSSKSPSEILSDLAVFNPHKERAFIRRGKEVFRYEQKKEVSEGDTSMFETGVRLLRRDVPDTNSGLAGERGEAGICYQCKDVSEQELCTTSVANIFANPHASTLEILP